ncbi:LysM peptidoglycan-binding domain-containing protein [Streptacidiphilus sp. N1-10]|uniref:LysM peptidoglycan-binding domain-containing protein n=1 Tax=Streptacidiphilus jeojiensis TaxID=3229225 RepID=A0ABV6XQB0_9ACTN
MGPQSRDAAPASASAAGRTMRRRHGALPGWRPVLVRGCAGLVLLPALLAGLPLVLLYGTLALARDGGPFGGQGLGGLMSAPDQGQLLVWVLAAIGWLAWAGFALGVLVELAARIGGRVPRRIPALGWSQRSAAALLGAVFALLPASGAFAAALPAPAAAVSATAPPAVAPTGAAKATAAAAAAYTVHTVQAVRPAETLWSIAESRLGSGDRWQEIARLNQGRVMDASGAVFLADAPLSPGWQLVMPADAVTVTQKGSPETSTTVTVTVHQGDTLTGIAEEHRVSGGWESVYAANRQVIGADPDVIQPGEQLRLPGAAPASARPTAAPTPTPTATPTPTPTPAPAHRSVPEQAVPEPAAAGAAAQGPAAPAPVAPHAGDPVRLPALGAAALLAAGLVGLLVRNRVRQQRRRPPRRRIPMPDVEEQQYEAFLRAVADPTGLDLLDRTLRTLGMTCLETGAELPPLTAVALRPGGTVDLHLAVPAPPLAPFEGSPDGRIWRCRAREAELIAPERAGGVPAPYPALVTLGRTLDGVHVLVDLEQVRHLHLDGSPEEVAAVSRALAAELAASPLADRIRLFAVGSPGPAGAEEAFGSDRMAVCGSADQALSGLAGHRSALVDSLTACQVPHPRSARSQGVATELWVPALLCTDQTLTEGQLAQLDWVLSGEEHRCIAAVTPATAGPGLHVDARPGHHGSPDGLPFAVELQRLTADEYAAALSLLATSRRPSDEPAPDWTGHDPEAEPDRDDPFVIPVLATRSRATGGGTPASATSVPLLDPDLPGAGRPVPGHRGGLIPSLSGGLRAHQAAEGQGRGQGQRQGEGQRHGHTHGHDHGPASVQDRLPQHPVPPSRTGPPPLGEDGWPLAPAPRILLLGPVRLIGTNGFAEPALTSQLTALAALLAAHPDPDPRLVDAVIHPVPYAARRPAAVGRRAQQIRTAALSRLRDWLGVSPGGVPYLDPAARRLHPAVTCDWTDFQDLYRHGMNASGPAEDAALRRALDLVRGGPFAGSHHLYPWAEPYRQDMVSAIIDASHELAKRRLAVGDLNGCETALHSGLAAVPEAEILHRGLIRLYATSGLGNHVAATITRLAQVNDALGCLDYEPETLELLDSIAGRGRTHRRRPGSGHRYRYRRI